MRPASVNQIRQAFNGNIPNRLQLKAPAALAPMLDYTYVCYYLDTFTIGRELAD